MFNALFKDFYFCPIFRCVFEWVYCYLHLTSREVGIRLELFRFHIHRLRCTSVFWAHFYCRLIWNFQSLNTLTNGWIHGGYLNMTYVVEVPWFPLLLHKCILPFLKILKIWKFLYNLLLKSPTKMDVRLILRYMGPV